MKPMTYRHILVAIAAIAALGTASAADRRIKITSRYLNFPISHSADRKAMTFVVDGRQDCRSVMRLTDAQPDYWTFRDVSRWRGKTITLSFDGPQAALDRVVAADTIVGASTMYAERLRPQYHFTTRRGWINDPNGLVYYGGKYHLFYQHNPYEREWENMHWGHAVSTDLTTWQELPDALHPDATGTMFSGSAVIDYGNTAHLNGPDGKPAMVALYTADSPEAQRQCMAYSLDEGLTFTKYDGNPVIDSHLKWQSHDTRDPKVFWYDKTRHWVMVLNERDGHSIYTSTDLKHWTFESHLTGFWECPELFELPVDGNPSVRKWVMWGASGAYMVGDFDGRRFTPLTPKQQNVAGSAYAAQVYNNIPRSDGRAIKMAWGRIDFPGMPFNGVMLLPQEQLLQTSHGGYRLLSRPAREVERLFTLAASGEDMTADEANALLARFDSDVLRISLTLEMTYATSAGLRFRGERIIDYDLNANTLNGTFYSPEEPGSMTLSADVYVDRRVVEVFADGGMLSLSFARDADRKSPEGYKLWGNDIKVRSLKVYRLNKDL